LFLNFFKSIFFSFSKIFFKKLKFKGKGFYIYKNTRNTTALQFGYSHLIYLYSFFINVKFLTKTTIFIFGINRFDLILSSNNLYNIKKINIFTGKGIRFSRQFVYRKTGKVSSYR
jgi:ribosomal protein L6P/L9E